MLLFHLKWLDWNLIRHNFSNLGTFPCTSPTMIEKNEIMILCSICTLIFVSGGKGGRRACHMHLCQLRSSKRCVWTAFTSACHSEGSIFGPCEKAPCTDLPPDPTLHNFLQNYAGGRVRQPRTPNTSAARVVANLIKLNSGSLSCQKGCFIHDSHMLTSDSFFSLQTQHDQSGKHKHNKQRRRRQSERTRNMCSLC